MLTSPGTIALIAEIDGRIAALGTAEPIGEEACEVAFLVSDEHRGRGLGTLLLEHLAAEARDRGVRHFEARVFRSNHRMLEVFADAGFQVDRRYEGDEEVVRMDTVVTPAIQAAADRREFAAERRSLAPLLNPTGVVVYGVRRDGSGIGGAVVTAIKDGGYAGGLTVVHPSAPEVLGVSAYSTARERRSRSTWL